MIIPAWGAGDLGSKHGFFKKSRGAKGAAFASLACFHAPEVEIPAVPSNFNYSSTTGSLSSSLGSCRDEWDIYNTRDKYLKQIEWVKNEWKTCESNKEKVLGFLRKTEIEGVSVVQRTKYYYAFRTLLSVIDKPFEDMTEKDLEDFLLHMNRMGYTIQTKKTRWSSLRKFFVFIGKEEMFTKIKVPFGRAKTKLPEELITEEEVNCMISKAYHIRDKAFISILYESGCRIGELLSRKLRHVIFDQYGAIVTVDGKTGMRRVRLIQSVPLLSNWIANHPLRDNPNAFLWINIRDYKNPIQYGCISLKLKKLARKCGIRKEIYPHLFRHSRATHLANKLTEQQLKIYFGWAGDSRMASVYVHLSGRDVDNAILEISGIKPKNEAGSAIHKPLTCPRCGKDNDPSAKFCSRCGGLTDIREIVNLSKGEADNFQDFLKDMYNKWKNLNRPCV